MADDKNLANFERKKSLIKDDSFRGGREVINYSEKEGFVEDLSKKNKTIAEAVDDIRGEGEFGGIQPIGGFVNLNIKRGKDIEDILSQDLTDVYLKLSPEKQVEFRRRGEAIAREINDLLDKAKLEVGRIIDLIKKWLFIIPGINKFFIEQEAKIKTDEIIRLRKI